MQAALQGLLVGLAIGVVLLLFEYTMISRGVSERAQKYHQKAEFDVSDKRRMGSMFRFSLLLPIGFAFMFWLIWG